jgi:anti-sigma factor RsiW
MAIPADDLTCRELVELVTAYLEHRLDHGQRDRFEAHLAQCPECRGFVDDLRATIVLLGWPRAEALSPEAERALLDAFRVWKRGLQPRA